MEQSQEKQPVEPLEAVHPPCPLHAIQAVAQIVGVAVEEPLFLDEVEKHDPVQHQRGVRFPVDEIRDTLDESLKPVALFFQTVVELPDGFVDVEGREHSV